MLSRVQPARDALMLPMLLRRAQNLLSQAQVGLGAAPCRSGQRSLNPSNQPRPGSETYPGRGGAGGRRGARALIQGASRTAAGGWGDAEGTRFCAHGSHFSWLNRAAKNAKTRESTQGPRLEMYCRPSEGSVSQ